MNDEDKVMGRIKGEQPDPGAKDGLGMRLVYMILIAVMISLAQTVLGVVTLIQFVILLINNRQPNERLAEFGTDLGIWIAKAARFQTAASRGETVALDRAGLRCPRSDRGSSFDIKLPIALTGIVDGPLRQIKAGARRPG